MSYQVLARKWRPKTFSTLVGQEHVVRALTHALETGRLHHAWLFTGTRGVGKTTISRILAKALNCETGVTPQPCGECEACRAIDADRFPDYVEMDAASNRGVDDMAALLDRAVYAPVQGRYKVYMIDEVHMLTGHAFNAMLKTLEEPPEHVKFILATTDPQKIPVTVLSRCLQFNLKQMPRAGIVTHLSAILDAEGVSYEVAALHHLAHDANGSMRDALSLLDQAIAHGAGRVEQEQVSLMLGTVGDDHLVGVLDALAAEDVSGMLALAEDMAARSLSFDAALQALATMLHRIALLQFAPAALGDEAERARLAPFAETFDAEFLQLAYQIVIHGREELALAPDAQTGFAMSLLRLFAFRPDNQPPGTRRPLPVAEASASRKQAPQSDAQSSAAERAGSAHATAPRPAVNTEPGHAAAVKDAPVAAHETDRASRAVEDAAAVAAAPARGDVPPWEALPETAWDESANAPADAEPALEAEPRPGVDAPELPSAESLSSAQPAAKGDQAGELARRCAEGDWRGALAVLGPSGLLRELCQHCEWLAREGDEIRLRLSGAHRHLLDMNPGLPARLGELFAAQGQDVRIRIDIGEIESGTPAQADEAERQLRHREALAALERDPFVCEVIQRFDATLVEASVRPLQDNLSGDAR